MAAGGEEDWSLPMEVEVLESIYLDELHVSRGSSRLEPWEISITLYPATADVQESQYVRFSLLLSVPFQCMTKYWNLLAEDVVMVTNTAVTQYMTAENVLHGSSSLPNKYPQEAPAISIQNPRGLSDEQLHSILKKLKLVAEAGLGAPMIYDLIEKGKDILTDNNIPHGQCVICLYGFQQNEAFIKTSCYHYFHSHCLASYVQHVEKELQHKQEEEQEQHYVAGLQEGAGVHCPVCRELLTYDLAALKAAPAPQHLLEEYCPNAQTKQRQQELLQIYKRQQAKGGIIDPEAEKNRYFISLQAPSEVETYLDASASETTVEDGILTSPLVDPSVHMTRPFRKESNLPETAPNATNPQRQCSQARRGREGFRGQYHSPRMANIAPQRGRISASTYSRDRRDYCRKPEKWELCDQKYKLDLSTTYDRNRAPILVEKDTDTITASNTEAQENATAERRGPGSWQSQCQTWDNRRWEKSNLREQGSYHRTQRSNGPLTSHGQEQRISLGAENKENS